MARVTKKQVDKAAADYAHEMSTYGPNSLSTSRALGRWQELQSAYEKQTGKKMYATNAGDGYIVVKGKRSGNGFFYYSGRAWGDKSTVKIYRSLPAAQRAVSGLRKLGETDIGAIAEFQDVSANPLLMTMGNPGRRLMGTDVLAVVYRHKEDGKLYCHGFGDADIKLTTRGDALTITALKEWTGVRMFAEPDGSVSISKPNGRVWEDM